jgi:hypothetical protein
VKVVRNTIIGFKKLEYVRILRELGNFIQKRIRDATPNEYKLQKPKEDYVKEMKKIMGKDDAEAGGKAEAGSCYDEAQAGGSVGGYQDEARAGGSQGVAEAGGSKHDFEAGGSKNRRL